MQSQSFAQGIGDQVTDDIDYEKLDVGDSQIDEESEDSEFLAELEDEYVENRRK